MDRHRVTLARAIVVAVTMTAVLAGCAGNGGGSGKATPSPTSTVVESATFTPSATPRSTSTLSPHTPASPGESPTPTPTPTRSVTPTPSPRSPTPGIEGTCFIGAPICTGTSLLTTRDDCCELSQTIAGPLPVAWCAEENLDPITLECSACEEPCEGQPTITPTSMPSPSPTATPSPSPTRSTSLCDVTNPCGQGEFCELPIGVCAADLDSGMCVDVPLTCFDPIEPVCGCDGLTYGSDCLRRGAQVQKSSDGVCPVGECDDACDCYATRTFATSCPLECANCGSFWTCEENRCFEHCGMIPLGVCEKFCSANDPCLPEEYCQKPVGQCAGLGACQPRPSGCPDVVDPVCGCDGQTYSNECDAADAGVAIDHRGPCDEVCGTVAGLACPERKFCEFPASSCDIADVGGICLEVPDACPTVVDPVCGCDGQTYDNDCVRQRARVQLDHPGSCQNG